MAHYSVHYDSARARARVRVLFLSFSSPRLGPATGLRAHPRRDELPIRIDLGHSSAIVSEGHVPRAKSGKFKEAKRPTAIFVNLGENL